MALFLSATGLLAAACASNQVSEPSPNVTPGQGRTEVTVTAPDDPEPNEVIAGTLTGEMVEEDALSIIRKYQEDFDACYEIEAVTDGIKRAAYVYEITVPPTDLEPTLTLRHRSNPEEYALEHCIDAAIKKVDFPAHRGAPLNLQVRIEGGVPVAAGAPLASITTETGKN